MKQTAQTRMELRGYRSVARGEKKPALFRSKHIKLGPIDLAELTNDELWDLHERAENRKVGPTLLDLKIELCGRIMRDCRLCERGCGVNRITGETGFCGLGAGTRRFFEQTLWGEEAPVVPSHEVFLSGCNLRCAFCYAWEWVVNPIQGQETDLEEFARLVDFRRAEGAANLNLIGGEPTVNLFSILRMLKLSENPTAVVWNSNFYMSSETMRLLDGVVDLYLGDFRFGNDRCAHEVAGTDRYFDTATRNYMMAADSGDLIIRHLVLPGHVECCLRPIAEWVAANLPDVPFNLMFQYLPQYLAVDDPALGRSLTPEEQAESTEIVRSLGLNTTRWNRPLRRHTDDRAVGSGEISTTIHVRPDGRVVIMHLHSGLRDLVTALQTGGERE